MQISIDGPAGAGKTTTAKALAKRLGFLYVDTGSLYRAVALYCVRHGIDVNDLEAVREALPGVSVSLDPAGAVLLDGEDVSGEIRTDEMSKKASDVSKHPCVRDKLLEIQRDMAEADDVVMEGRDIGSMVLPDADVKFYLNAALLARAGRRYQDNVEKRVLNGKTEAQVAAELMERDEQDMYRPVAPLVVPAGAVVVDNTNLSFQETVEVMLTVIRLRMRED